MNETEIDRREFGRWAARTALAAGGLGVATSLTSCTAHGPRDPDQLAIVDTHQHLWDLSKFNPPWLSGAPEVLAKSYVTKDYVEASAKLNVVKAVYMEVDVNPDRQIDEAEHVIDLAKSADNPTVAAVISGRPASNEFRDYIGRYRDNPYVKGVRQVIHVESAKRGLCLENQFVRSAQFLGEIGKSFDLCMRPRELADGVELARQCPDTLFIVDHCGNADPKAFLPVGSRGGEEPWHEVDQWKRDMSAFAALDNVVCKISGIVARAPRNDWSAADLAPIIDYCLDEFGPDRVVFGSDWPVCKLTASYSDWVTALLEIISKRSYQDQVKLLSANAIRLYGLT